MNPDRASLSWIAARKRHQLSHAHVQMARELGMDPRKLGKIDNHQQETWKVPLPRFIEQLYEKRFGKTRPDVVVTTEQRMAAFHKKKDERREKRKLARDLGEGALIKVFGRQNATLEQVAALQALAPSRKLNPRFTQIVSEGTGKSFELEHNQRWGEVTRPIVEAFFHARFFLETAVRSATALKTPPQNLPSDWAALLYLYELR